MHTKGDELMTTETAIQRKKPETIRLRNSETTSSRSAWTYRPNVDIVNTADEILLQADLPGADPEQIDVSIEGGVLTLSAAIAPRTQPNGRTIVTEYGIGNFHRRFEVDDTIDSEHLTADYDAGVLTVHLPKAARAKRRRIPVQSS
jgi:HSP20 family protein